MSTDKQSIIPIYLSMVVCIRNRQSEVEGIARELSSAMASIVSDYELIFVDNASTDGTLDKLRDLCGQDGIANLQVYGLTRQVDLDQAQWAGVENSLGDFVAVVNPAKDDLSVLPEMIQECLGGVDLVLARPHNTGRDRSVPRSLGLLHRLYFSFTGFDVLNETPRYRVLSRRAINYVLQHARPAEVYFHLPLTGGLSKRTIVHESIPSHVAVTSAAKPAKRRGNRGSYLSRYNRGMRLALSTTNSPMRFLTYLCGFGAAANLLYSVYVVLVSFMRDDVTPGWVSMSLQFSGMFFLISLVLMGVGEYLIILTERLERAPGFHVGQEFTSAKLTRLEKLNVEMGQARDSDAVDLAPASDPETR